jgi:hypothetical protein
MIQSVFDPTPIAADWPREDAGRRVSARPAPAHTGWSPDQIDTSIAHPARMHDYYLGGHDNYEVDQALAERVLALMPQMRDNARANRAFRGRAVARLARLHGVEQFLDIGTGIPGPGSTGQIARRFQPHARVVYADNDPLVLTHAQALLTGEDPEGTAVVYGDVRDPDGLLADRDVDRVLDLRRPVAVLMTAVLHLVPDHDRPQQAIARLMSAVAAGSFLVVSHATGDFQPDIVDAVGELYLEAASPAIARTRGQVQQFFHGLAPLEPGVVHLPAWHPDEGDQGSADPADVWMYAGVGEKP